MAEHFVIAAYQRKDNLDTCIFHVLALSPSQAHKMAEEQYREDHKLLPQVHVKTNTLYRNVDGDKASEFTERLFEEMEKHAAANNSA